MTIPTSIHQPDDSGRFWWCNSHQRKATFVHIKLNKDIEHCCDPNLGGILLPCSCVDLTDELEILE